jgi:uroporphyrinogen III methyltransferase / synthase
MRIPETPLAGRRIVLTRTPQESGILLHKLKGSGAEVIVLPFIEFRPPENRVALDAAIVGLDGFDWVVFTSQNAVRFFSGRLRELGREFTGMAGGRPKTAAVGRATAQALADQHLPTDMAAIDARSGREFVREFSSNAKGKKILLPQSDQAAPYVADGLREGGASVTCVVAYRTCMPESLDGEALNRVRREGADAFVFASPSAFRNFERTLGPEEVKKLSVGAAFVAIGPTTAEAIREAGAQVKIEAKKPDSQEIVRAMLEYFSAALRHS